MTFCTEDLYLAALFITGGVKFIGAKREGARGIFTFEDSPLREKLMMEYFNGQAVQNIRRYVDHWIALKRLVQSLPETRR